ncbi:sorting nexin-8-like isoform X2 [Cylas formicarius]|uniref:sorting nexin-8-like isoform X2 n=1 Tax=Cylas formicarius TaxID=197179 RepID=UPI0029589E38|nr:sorting nexin-8-like isoform X2 [Cylas formicarius]
MCTSAFYPTSIWTHPNSKRYGIWSDQTRTELLLGPIFIKRWRWSLGLSRAKKYPINCLIPLREQETASKYPSPTISDLSSIQTLKAKLILKNKPASNFHYHRLVQMDTVNVQLVPEKKGLFLKHSEYFVTSRRFASNVTRRYTDFVVLQDLLLNRFPYRLVPSLPPKKIIISDNQFLKERRRGLHRWLTLVCRHPVMSRDALIGFFLTDQGSDFQTRIKAAFRRVPDEFMTSDLAANAKELLPNDHNQIAMSRECVHSLVNTIGRLKLEAEASVERGRASARDLEDLSVQLKNISQTRVEDTRHFVENWAEIRTIFAEAAGELHPLSRAAAKHSDLEQDAVCEKVALLLDVLVAHKELCERLEKGLAHDHQVALAKMLSLKKKKLQGAIRGADTESIEQLETKMLTQENVITNIDLRTDFSLYCVHMETQLVFTYLGTMPAILASLIDLKTRSHFELLDLWRHLQTRYCEGGGVNGM